MLYSYNLPILEDIYDLNTIELQDLQENIQKQLIINQNITDIEEKKQFIKKSNKLQEIIDLELKEREDIENFGKFICDRKHEEEFIKNLEQNDFIYNANPNQSKEQYSKQNQNENQIFSWEKLISELSSDQYRQQNYNNKNFIKELQNLNQKEQLQQPQQQQNSQQPTLQIQTQKTQQQELLQNNQINQNSQQVIRNQNQSQQIQKIDPSELYQTQQYRKTFNQQQKSKNEAQQKLNINKTETIKQEKNQKKIVRASSSIAIKKKVNPIARIGSSKKSSLYVHSQSTINKDQYFSTGKPQISYKYIPQNKNKKEKDEKAKIRSAFLKKQEENKQMNARFSIRCVSQQNKRQNLDGESFRFENNQYKVKNIEQLPPLSQNQQLKKPQQQEEKMQINNQSYIENNNKQIENNINNQEILDNQDGIQQQEQNNSNLFNIQNKSQLTNLEKQDNISQNIETEIQKNEGDLNLIENCDKTLIHEDHYESSQCSVLPQQEIILKDLQLQKQKNQQSQVQPSNININKINEDNQDQNIQVINNNSQQIQNLKDLKESHIKNQDSEQTTNNFDNDTCNTKQNICSHEKIISDDSDGSIDEKLETVNNNQQIKPYYEINEQNYQIENQQQIIQQNEKQTQNKQQQKFIEDKKKQFLSQIKDEILLKKYQNKLKYMNQSTEQLQKSQIQNKCKSDIKQQQFQEQDQKIEDDRQIIEKKQNIDNLKSQASLKANNHTQKPPLLQFKISHPQNRNKMKNNDFNSHNTIKNQAIQKIMDVLGDRTLIDYTDLIPTFTHLFSVTYNQHNIQFYGNNLKSHQTNQNNLEYIYDYLVEQYNIFRNHYMQVDQNHIEVFTTCRNSFNQIQISQQNNQNQLHQQPQQILYYSNMVNIDVRKFVEREVIFQKRKLQIDNDEDLPIQTTQQYYRVVKNKSEVYDIINRGFLRTQNWYELPHGQNLKTSWNLLWTWAKPQIDFNKLIYFQKVNHFPQNKNLARKDLLRKNVDRLKRLGPKAEDEFNILPLTFILPKEYTNFSEEFHKQKYQDPKNNIWIIKPIGKSRGRGIQVVSEISQVVYSEPVVVQKYIPNPLLIRGYKFDLRIYVLVTSFKPLEAFLYTEGFARFSTEKYNLDAQNLHNNFIHLTNYSIQKQNNFKTDPNNLTFNLGGSKISLKLLKEQLIQKGICWEKIWSQIEEICVKSLIACQQDIPNNPNCFEIFGYDIFIDTNEKCSLIEINSSPSLAREFILDDLVKQQLIDDTIALVDPIIFDRKRLLDVLERRIKETQGQKSTINTQNNSKQQLNRDLNYILNSKKIRKYGELPQNMGNFIRIAPSPLYNKIIKIINQYKQGNHVQ